LPTRCQAEASEASIHHNTAWIAAQDLAWSMESPLALAGRKPVLDMVLVTATTPGRRLRGVGWARLRQSRVGRCRPPAAALCKRDPDTRRLSGARPRVDENHETRARGAISPPTRFVPGSLSTFGLVIHYCVTNGMSTGWAHEGRDPEVLARRRRGRAALRHPRAPRVPRRQRQHADVVGIDGR
jgi:hypothetical protein